MTFGIDFCNFCLSLYNSTTPSSALWTLVPLSLKQKFPLVGEKIWLCRARKKLHNLSINFFKRTGWAFPWVSYSEVLRKLKNWYTLELLGQLFRRESTWCSGEPLELQALPSRLSGRMGVVSPCFKRKLLFKPLATAVSSWLCCGVRDVLFHIVLAGAGGFLRSTWGVQFPFSGDQLSGARVINLGWEGAGQHCISVCPAQG